MRFARRTRKRRIKLRAIRLRRHRPGALLTRVGAWDRLQPIPASPHLTLPQRLARDENGDQSCQWAYRGVPGAGGSAAALEAALPEAYDEEQKKAALWWLRSGFSTDMGRRAGDPARSFVESIWFPLFLILSLTSGLALVIKFLTLPENFTAFTLWLVYLFATLFVSRYGFAQSVLGTSILVGHVMLLYGVDIIPMPPTLLYVISMYAIGCGCGLSHQNLIQLVAERGLALKQMSGMGRGGGGAGRGGGSEMHPELIESMRELSVARDFGIASAALQRGLGIGLGATAAELWSVSGAGEMVLFKNLQSSFAREGTRIDISGDDFLTWLCKERRSLVFDPSQSKPLQEQFGELLPNPLLPIASLARGNQVAVILRVTVSSRKEFGPEHQRALEILTSLLEGAMERSGVHSRMGKGK
jgi:hypothetical protein